MTELVAFKKEHGLEIQNSCSEGNPGARRLTETEFEVVEKDGFAKTILIDGVAKACGGYVEHHANRCVVWSIIHKDAKQDFLPIAKALKEFVENLPHKRVESTVKSDFEEGHRLNEFLGFQLEVREMKNYGALGDSYSLYSRVK